MKRAILLIVAIVFFVIMVSLQGCVTSSPRPHVSAWDAYKAYGGTPDYSGMVRRHLDGIQPYQFERYNYRSRPRYGEGSNPYYLILPPGGRGRSFYLINPPKAPMIERKGSLWD